MQYFLLCVVSCCLFADAAAQQQTVRGVVFDRDTRAPLIGASVVVRGSSPLLGTATDAEGRFVLPRMPFGRYTLQVRYLGYAPRDLYNVLVRAGQETVLEIALEEQLLEGTEVVVQAAASTGQPLNDMATVSGRSFSAEEARRYAGAVDDPARLAASFAGVMASGSGVQDNALAIRGNAPKGVLWLLEGIPIPNPNHFAGLSVAGGGGLTLFSGQLLAASDVFTGAFPAEYGNALSGVFDMRFRTGNPATREHTVQVGLLGVEGASEGPFQIGAPATYLFNYRYSTLGLLMPLLPTDAGTTYQDMAFKLAFPTRRAGRFEVWGMGGLDGQRLVENRDSTTWASAFWDRTRFRMTLGVGAGGLTHHVTLGRNTYVQTSAALTFQHTDWDQEYLGDDLALRPDLRLRNREGRAVLSTTVSHKVSPRFLFQTGATLQHLFYDLDLHAAPRHVPPRVPVAVGQGRTTLGQAFGQARFTPAAGLNLHAGVRAQVFALTEAVTLEPRLGLAWDVGGGQVLSAGYGLHSQVEDLRLYLVQHPSGTFPNRSLRPAQAHHVVVGYARPLTETMQMRLEGYVQSLFDVPVIADSSFSLLNFRQDWTFDEALINRGAGRNLGVELTLERSLRNGFYALLNGSLFRSRYRGGDGVWRPTRFDQSYAVNALAGREFNTGAHDLLGVNVRVAALGGERRSPVDEDASAQRQEVVYDEVRAFHDRAPAIWLVDLTLTYRRNGTWISQVWALQLKNALVAKDTTFDYHLQRKAVEEIREGYPLPVLSYKLEF